jgi:hypothetical protein
MRRIVFAGLALAALALPAAAADDPMAESTEAWLARSDALPVMAPPGPLLTPLDGGWDFRVTAYAYIPKSNIDAELGGASGHLTGDFGDAVTTGVRVEAVGNRFGILLELEAQDLESKEGSSDYTFRDSRADLGAIFRVVGPREGRLFKLDIFGGVRYHSTTQDSGSDDSDSWWSPMVGAEARIPFIVGDILVRMSAAGFGAGPTSLDFTGSAALEFLIGPVFAQVGLMYRSIDFSTSTGGGYSLDAQSWGPFIAFGVDF